jgi:hypothetical protein
MRAKKLQIRTPTSLNSPTIPLFKDKRTPEEIFALLLQMIEKSGFQIETLQWLKTEVRNGCKITTISLQISGDFSRYFLLLTKMFTFALPIELKSFVIKVANTRTIIFMKCAIWHVKNTTSPAPSFSPLTLHNTPLNMLKFVGLMQSSKKMIGMIALPNGEICRVQMHDEIGKEKAKVIRINRHAITVLDGKLRKRV